MEGGKSCIKTFCWGGECSRTQVHVNVVVSKGRRLVLDGGRCATVVRHARTAFPLSLFPPQPLCVKHTGLFVSTRQVTSRVLQRQHVDGGREGGRRKG